MVEGWPNTDGAGLVAGVPEGWPNTDGVELAAKEPTTGLVTGVELTKGLTFEFHFMTRPISAAAVCDVSEADAKALNEFDTVVVV